MAVWKYIYRACNEIQCRSSQGESANVVVRFVICIYIVKCCMWGDGNVDDICGRANGYDSSWNYAIYS